MTSRSTRARADSSALTIFATTPIQALSRVDENARRDMDALQTLARDAANKAEAWLFELAEEDRWEVSRDLTRVILLECPQNAADIAVILPSLLDAIRTINDGLPDDFIDAPLGRAAAVCVENLIVVLADLLKFEGDDSARAKYQRRYFSARREDKDRNLFGGLSA